jgi:hypothetical protein
MIYSAFGLTIAASRTIPGLVPDTRRRTIDVRIRLDSAWPQAHWLSQDLWYTDDFEQGTEPDLRVWTDAGRHFRFRYEDGVEFTVNRAGTDVWAGWPDTSTLEDASTYLLGPVLGFVLRLRGVVCLHASAVAVGDRAVLIAGPPGAGKSTAAAAFWQMGHAILTDDVAPIVEADGVPFAQPAYPQLRLWPDSVTALCGSVEALPRLTPGWDKRALDLRAGGGGFYGEKLSIGAIYVLDEVSAGRAAGIETLAGRERVLALVANSYTGYLLDAAMRADELAFLTRLAGSVPVRRLVPAADAARPERVCEQILDDCEALGCTASPTTAR